MAVGLSDAITFVRGSIDVQKQTLISNTVNDEMDQFESEKK